MVKSSSNKISAAPPKTAGFPGCLNYTNITEYLIGKMLGNGAYAFVKAATHKTSGMKLAIKVYDKFKLNMNQQVKKSVTREIRLLSILGGISKEEVVVPSKFGKGNKDIMRLYDAIDTPK